MLCPSYCGLGPCGVRQQLCAIAAECGCFALSLSCCIATVAPTVYRCLHLVCFSARQQSFLHKTRVCVCSCVHAAGPAARKGIPIASESSSECDVEHVGRLSFFLFTHFAGSNCTLPCRLSAFRPKFRTAIARADVLRPAAFCRCRGCINALTCLRVRAARQSSCLSCTLCADSISVSTAVQALPMMTT